MLTKMLTKIAAVCPNKKILAEITTPNFFKFEKYQSKRRLEFEKFHYLRHWVLFFVTFLLICVIRVRISGRKTKIRVFFSKTASVWF